MARNRLFIGLSVEAPWPSSYPEGRLLREKDRHITLAFLGNVALPDIQSFPRPPFQLGQAAISNKVAFLPKKTPRVVAYEVEWVSGEAELTAYREELYQWAENQGLQLDPRPFQPHLTVARSPFIEKDWEVNFEKLPLMITGVHLYESIGNLRYLEIFSIPLTRVFDEVEHTADIAFKIRGKNLREIYAHAILAMSFEFPPFFTYQRENSAGSLDEVVKFLNRMIAECDRDHGCPFKAVSYHGNLDKEEQWLTWEMVVDV